MYRTPSTITPRRTRPRRPCIPDPASRNARSDIPPGLLRRSGRKRGERSGVDRRCGEEVERGSRWLLLCLETGFQECFIPRHGMSAGTKRTQEGEKGGKGRTDVFLETPDLSQLRRGDLRCFPPVRLVPSSGRQRVLRRERGRRRRRGGKSVPGGRDDFRRRSRRRRHLWRGEPGGGVRGRGGERRRIEFMPLFDRPRATAFPLVTGNLLPLLPSLHRRPRPRPRPRPPACGTLLIILALQPRIRDTVRPDGMVVAPRTRSAIGTDGVASEFTTAALEAGLVPPENGFYFGCRC